MERERSRSPKRPEHESVGNGTAVSSTAEADASAPAKRAPIERLRKRDCPYLSTVNRNVLDFDFDRVCSVTLSDQNIYVCLVCGKFFQGRGRGTCAYTHALEHSHYVFMNLDTTAAYCLPDDYEIVDASLSDIKFNLKPRFSRDQVLKIATGEAGTYHAKSLDGVDFIPGCVGLNNIKNAYYLNVLLQIFCSIVPIRNFLLEYTPPVVTGKQDPVLVTLADTVKKMHNTSNFKGIVSPHDFFQAVGRASKKKFYGDQHDPVAFFSWIMQYLKKRMMKERAQEGKSETEGSFNFTSIVEGEVAVKSSQVAGQTKWTDSAHNSLMLQLELPAAPLFKEDYDFIPQVALFTLLEKFNGETVHENITKSGESRELRKFSIRRLAPYVIFQVKRFNNNNYFVEKNPTIVNFPLKDLDLAPYLHPDAAAANPVTKYNLVSNVVHQGKPQAGEYKVQTFHKPSQQWYEIQDLRVTEILPQAVALAETYLLIYERADVKPDGTYGHFEDLIITEATEKYEEEEVLDLEAMGIQIS